jgi:hypothetical protein
MCSGLFDTAGYDAEGKQLLPKATAKKVVAGKFDICFSDHLGASAWDVGSGKDFGGSGGAKGRDNDLDYHAWRHAMRMLANTMTMRWPQMAQPLERYMDNLRRRKGVGSRPNA